MLSESFTKSNEVTGLFKSQNAAKVCEISCFAFYVIF